jgi:hypothetical protein
MFMQLLGSLDVLAAMLLIFSPILPSQPLLLAAVYLMVKGLLFLLGGDTVSMIEMAVGFYFIFAAFDLVWNPITVLCALFLLQKGVLSFVQ